MYNKIHTEHRKYLIKKKKLKLVNMTIVVVLIYYKDLIGGAMKG